MRKIETDDCVVKFDDNREVRDKVFEAVVKFFVEHEVFCGESIMQCDAPQIDGPELLSEIADDIIKFDVEYKE